MNLIKNKKALAMRTFIIVAVLVLSFVLILFAFTSFNFTENINREACHTSVILRASAAIGKVAEFKEAIPLQCKTEEVCLTSGFLSKGCDSLGKDYDKIKVEDEDDVLDIISDYLYDWHVVLGEGKVNFMEKEIRQEKSCFLTTVISLDPDLKKSIGEISYYDLYKTMELKKTLDGNSYLSEVYNVNSAEDLYYLDPETEDYVPLLNLKINLSEDQVIVSKVITKGYLDKIIGGTVMGIGTGTLVAIAPFTGGASVAILAGIGTAGGSTYALFPQPHESYLYISPMLYPYDSNDIQKLGCDSIETLA